MKTFNSTRLKLTLWYMLISYSLLILFTIAVISAERQAFAQVIDLVHSHVRGVVFNIYLQQQIEAFESHFSRWLLLFDAIILVLATAASYFLSGRSLAPIVQAMQDQERFAADVSHELRTPLASMAMEIEAYQRGDKNAHTTKQVMASLQEEVKRMTGIVTGLMHLVRLDQVDSTSQLLLQQPVDMSALVSKALESVSRQMTERQLKLKSHIATAMLVKGNPDELRQVVLILLDNALKYTPIKGLIEVDLIQEEEHVRLTVFNSGPGIIESDLSHVFDRFYRGQNVVGDEGSGLGLAIARHIVEQHSGAIAVASQPDHGVTFRVLLPHRPYSL